MIHLIRCLTLVSIVLTPALGGETRLKKAPVLNAKDAYQRCQKSLGALELELAKTISEFEYTIFVQQFSSNNSEVLCSNLVRKYRHYKNVVVDVLIRNVGIKLKRDLMSHEVNLYSQRLNIQKNTPAVAQKRLEDAYVYYKSLISSGTKPLGVELEPDVFQNELNQLASRSIFQKMEPGTAVKIVNDHFQWINVLVRGAAAKANYILTQTILNQQINLFYRRVNYERLKEGKAHELAFNYFIDLVGRSNPKVVAAPVVTTPTPSPAPAPAPTPAPAPLARYKCTANTTNVYNSYAGGEYANAYFNSLIKSAHDGFGLAMGNGSGGYDGGLVAFFTHDCRLLPLLDGAGKNPIKEQGLSDIEVIHDSHGASIFVPYTDPAFGRPNYTAGLYRFSATNAGPKYEGRADLQNGFSHTHGLEVHAGGLSASASSHCHPSPSNCQTTTGVIGLWTSAGFQWEMEISYPGRQYTFLGDSLHTSGALYFSVQGFNGSPQGSGNSNAYYDWTDSMLAKRTSGNSLQILEPLLDSHLHNYNDHVVGISKNFEVILYNSAGQLVLRDGLRQYGGVLDVAVSGGNLLLLAGDGYVYVSDSPTANNWRRFTDRPVKGGSVNFSYNAITKCLAVTSASNGLENVHLFCE